MDGIPPARRGTPQIEVTFDIDANGIVNVSAKDLGTGKEQHITITSSSNMSDSDIERAVQDAKRFEAEDRKRKENVEAKNNAEQFAFHVEQSLNGGGNAEVQEDLKSLRELLNEYKDREIPLDELNRRREKLEKSSQAYFESMYSQAQNQNQNQNQYQQGSYQGNQDDSDVVDADYREVS